MAVTETVETIKLQLTPLYTSPAKQKYSGLVGILPSLPKKEVSRKARKGAKEIAFLCAFAPLRETCSFFSFSSPRRYSQVLESRHFGRDAEIQRPRMANHETQQMPLYPRTVN